MLGARRSRDSGLYFLPYFWVDLRDEESGCVLQKKRLGRMMVETDSQKVKSQISIHLSTLKRNWI